MRTTIEEVMILERSGFIMERKQSLTNKTRLFFLNPRMTVFLKEKFLKKK